MAILDLDFVPNLDPNSFDYLEGVTIEQLEDEITGLEKAVASAKAAKAKWIKLLDLANRAGTAKKRSTRQDRINLSEKDSLGNTQSLKEFINPSQSGLQLKISITRSTASGKVQQYTRSYANLLNMLKTKQQELQDLKQEVAATETEEAKAVEAGAKAGAAIAVESGAKTKNVFMYVIFGVVVLVSIILIIRLIKK